MHARQALYLLIFLSSSYYDIWYKHHIYYLYHKNGLQLFDQTLVSTFLQRTFGFNYPQKLKALRTTSEEDWSPCHKIAFGLRAGLFCAFESVSISKFHEPIYPSFPILSTSFASVALMNPETAYPFEEHSCLALSLSHLLFVFVVLGKSK